MHPSAHNRLMEMLTQVGIVPEASCSATTPADIQWMVRAGYGVALIDQRTPIDSALTTWPIAGIHWTADTAFVPFTASSRCVRQATAHRCIFVVEAAPTNSRNRII